jgi:hypothetical protein
MQLAQPHPDCTVDHEGEYVRAHVGGGSATEVQECYRTVASIALEHKFNRVLIIGLGTDDAHSHLTARDIVVAFDVIGVPIGFKVAFVPKSDVTLNGYRHAEIEADKRGLRAKVFFAEHDAIRWLTEPELH